MCMVDNPPPSSADDTESGSLKLPEPSGHHRPVIRLVYLYQNLSTGWDRSVGTATRYRLDGPGIESWCKRHFLQSIHTRPGAHPASYTMSTRSFPGVKQPGCGIDHPTPSNTGVKERLQLYLYPTSGTLWPVIG
jgi:hypothetical protein